MKERCSDEALFFEVCQLLNAVENLWQKKNPSRRKLIVQVSSQWFSKFSSGTLYLLFRLLLPGLDYARAFGIKEQKLAQLTVHALGLEETLRGNALLNWRDENFPGYLRAEMSLLIEHLTKGEGICKEKPEITIIQVDSLLTDLGDTICCQGKDFHSPSVKERSSGILKSLFYSMTSIEIKWICRIILKEFPESIDLDPKLIFDAFHGWMWKIYRGVNELQSCCEGIVELISRGNHQAKTIDEFGWFALTKNFYRPMLGVPVGSMLCGKTHNLNHILNRIEGKPCIIEEKYSGEKFQAHLCASWPNKLRVFDKRGKDITGRIFDIHQLLIDSCGLGNRVENAIIEGEFLICDEKINEVISSDIFPLLKQQNNRERHLMAIIFDIIYLNSESLLLKPLSQRKQHLSQSIRPIPTYVELSHFVLLDINCDRRSSIELEFEKNLQSKNEGLIIKDFTSSYLPNNKTNWFHLKKDCIEGFSDTGKFLVVGMSYSKEQSNMISGLAIGCVVNAFEIEESEQRPLVHVLFCANCEIAKEQVFGRRFLNILEHSKDLSYDLVYSNSNQSEFNIDGYLEKPLVAELSSEGFQKTSYGHWILHSPRIKKIFQPHEKENLNGIFDQVLSFNRLQEIALEAIASTSKNNFELDKLEFIRSFKIIPEIGDRHFAIPQNKNFTENSKLLIENDFEKLNSLRSMKFNRKCKPGGTMNFLPNHSQNAIIQYYYIPNRLEAGPKDISVIDDNFKGLKPLYTLSAVKQIEKPCYLIFPPNLISSDVAGTQNFPKWCELIYQ